MESSATKRKLRDRVLDRFDGDGNRRRRFGGGTNRLPISDDSKLSLDYEEIGRKGSYFLLANSTQYLRRHVETVQILSDSFARRRLTIDIQLPSEADLGFECDNGDVVFWMPATAITKKPPRSNIDLRDESGRAVPLLTRRENGLISQAALVEAAKDLTGAPPSPLLVGLLRETVECSDVAAEVAGVLVENALKSVIGEKENEHTVAFTDSVQSLAGNAWAWIPFRGRTGERRVLKFHYDIEFDRPHFFRQRPKTHRYLVAAGEAHVALPLELPERGDENPYSPPRRLATRIASSTGLGAVNLGVKSAYLVAGQSYHLQVESPPGVETRDIDLLADLESKETEGFLRRSHGIHLYVSGARLKDKETALVLVALRVGRRGFMTLSWVSIVLSVALLWLFDLTARSHLASREATATVLLFGPALLAALIVRPGEHPVATRLFSGVRLMVAFNGLLAVAAAAAVAGVRPDGWTIEHAWFIYALVASGVALLLTVSWVLSWASTYRVLTAGREELRSVTRYRHTCTVLVAFVGAVLLVGGLGVRASADAGIYLSVLVGLSLACAFVSSSYARLGRSSAGFAWVCVSLAGLGAAAAAADMIMKLTAGWEWKEPCLGFAVATLLAATALVVQDLVRRKRGLDRPDEELPNRGEGDKSRPLGIGELTPSAARVRRQARKAGVAVPDFLAESAYHEAEIPDELFAAGHRMYADLVAGAAGMELLNGAGNDLGPRRISSRKEAERLAEEQDRELIFFDV
jgi:hypothetical protein